MNPRIVGQIILLLLFATQVGFGAIRTVSKSADDGGQYRTISDAVKAAEAGDEIVIKDFGVYEEQVTINKNKITLRSDDPALAKKPTIKWKDTKNVGPKTGDEALIDSLITFDQNGALRVMRCQGVTINGIVVDGGGSAPFAYTGIWNRKDPLFHGNAAITLWIAGDVTIKNCELQNAYFGLNVKDRNEGGIFANANPADIEKWKVVPLSGFGKTGNHIIERNRIHNNDVGMFFESAWDLGSVIRYNLIYDNHHAPTDYAKIKTMPDGGNQPGGAIMFKDNLLSPLAIYNNTFWHNSLLIIGHWKAGHQHAIFNNLFAEPYTYWSKITDLTDWMDLDPKFTLRSHNNLYAAQKQAPETRSQEYQANAQDPITNKPIEEKKKVPGVQGIQLMNGMTKWQIEGEIVEIVLTFSDGTDSIVRQRAEWIIQPGALCLDFPNAANIRWLEPKFKSVDPTSANFLVPDWDEPIMKKFIVDQGWAEGGIYDNDGSIADIGAIPYTGKYQETLVMVKPTDAVVINNTTATASFNLSVLAGSIKDPKIEYAKWIDALPYDKDAFGAVAKLVLTSTNVLNATPTPTSLKVGINQISFSVPARTSTNGYAFLEIVVSGNNEKGEKVSSMVGFLPYRNLEYKFLVQIFSKNDVTFKSPLKEVKAGEVVVMRVEPQRSNGTPLTTEHIDTAEATLNSSYILYNDQLKKFTFPRDFVGARPYDVVFTKVPDNGSLEIVSVSGKFLVNTKDTIGNAIRGSSDGIKILPGDPDSVKFYDPASGGIKVVNPGITSTIVAKVYDKFGNLVDKSGQADVKLTSLKPTTGDVDGASTSTTDDTGTVYFKVKITNGKLNDTFPLVATLVTNSKTDQAFGVVGKNRDKFKIFYSDTVGGYNESAKIEGSAGERFPVTITAGNDSADIITTRNSSFIIDFQENAGILAAYANATDTVPIQGSKLVNGKTVIWITSTGKSVSNGQIVIYADSDNTILKGSRYNIFFTEPAFKVSRGAYFADNGIGQVDRLEIFYEDTLKDNTSLPDTIELYWPIKSDANKKIVVDKNSMTLDASNKKHVTVKLNDPFDSCVTANSGSTPQLGTTYWKNPTAPASAVQKSAFNIADSVGPLLKSAILVERLKDGDDTLYITFSEAVNPATIVGKTLKVIKRSGADTIDMDISAAVAIGGDTIRIVAKNAAGDSPESGDLIKINSSGSITDLFNNYAHKDNRPVIIRVKTIPAEIVSAAYFDKDGNGIVDYLTIRFTKKVSKESLKVFGLWEQNANKFKDFLSGNSLEKGADDLEIGVKIDGAFNVEPKDVTSGSFYVEVTNLDFPDIKIPGKLAADSAAPVIMSAIYYPGMAISQCQSAPDTLKVAFSENVKMPVFDSLTFNFKHNTDSYAVVLDKILSENGKQITYLVKNPEVFPVNGDMINIRVKKIADDKNNLQAVPDNKWVALKVESVPYSLITNIGPNPFKAGTNVVYITVDALTKMKEIVDFESEMVIYDKMGSLVNELKTKNEKVSVPDKCNPGKNVDLSAFVWDGTNLKGRFVGAGTYVAIVKVVDKNATNNAKPISKKIYIGVKR